MIELIGTVLRVARTRTRELVRRLAGGRWSVATDREQLSAESVAVASARRRRARQAAFDMETFMDTADRATARSIDQAQIRRWIDDGRR